DHGVAVARTGEAAHVGDAGQALARLRPQRADFFGERAAAARGTGVEILRRQAPEKAQARRRVAGTRADGQEAAHLARGDVALTQLVRVRPLALRYETPEGAPRVRPVEPRLADRTAQRRGGAIGGEHEIVGAVLAACLVAEPASRFVDGDHACAAMHTPSTGPSVGKNRKQGTALHAEAE